AWEFHDTAPHPKPVVRRRRRFSGSVARHVDLMALDVDASGVAAADLCGHRVDIHRRPGVDRRSVGAQALEPVPPDTAEVLAELPDVAVSLDEVVARDAVARNPVRRLLAGVAGDIDVVVGD